MSNLMDDGFKPRIGSFDLACHMRELETDDGVFDELLTESTTLVGVFDGFFVADSRETDTLDDDAYSLVVEVCHDDCRVLV